MIEVLDEILEGEPLYRIRDKEGNILFDNVTVEMITAVLQNGTPINKALFDNIKSYIDNLIPSNYVVGSVKSSTEGSLPITCGFKPVAVIVVPYEINYNPSTYGIVAIGDKAFNVNNEGNSKTNVSLSDNGCTMYGTIKTTSTYRYIAFKG